VAGTPDCQTDHRESERVGMKKVRGVYLRGGKAYIRYRDEHGNLVRESTEQKSLKFAEDLLAKRRTEVAEGRHFPTKQFDRVSFKELLDDWWEKHGQHTRSRFVYHLPKIRENFEARRAREIDADCIEQFLDKLERGELSASSINKYRTILCSTFNFAIKRGKFDRNPVSAVPQRKEPPGRDRFLSAEDFRKLIAECKSDLALHAFVWIAATTGARKGELLPRKWSEVQLDGNSPHIYIPRSKNGRPKRLSLAEQAIAALRALPSLEEEEYVFPADRGNVRFTFGICENPFSLRACAPASKA
jgi:integrase